MSTRQQRINMERFILRSMLEDTVPVGKKSDFDFRTANAIVRQFRAVPRLLSSGECTSLVREWVYGKEEA